MQPVTGGRSLFEAGGQPATGVTVVPVHPPILMPQARPAGSLATVPGGTLAGGAAAIPLKYYGYVRPAETVANAKQPNGVNNRPKTPANVVSANRGFFLDGDNVLVASEGDLLKQRYLVVALTPNSARLEDTQLRQGETLPVIAAAMP